MRRLRLAMYRLASLVGRRRADDDLADELASHLDLLEQELRGQGIAPDEAHRLARLRLGGLSRTVHAVHDARMAAGVERLRQDVAWALRALRRAPLFTLATVLTIALGIGGTVAIFTLVNAVLWRPLPYPAPDRLLALTADTPASFSGEMFHALRARLEGGERLAAIGGATSWNLLAGTHAVHVTGGRVSAATFDVLGVQPRLGRGFTAAEDSPGGPAVVVLGDALWRSQFDARPDILGQIVHLGGIPHQVIGVMPPHFATFPAAQLWGPLQLSPRDQGTNYQVLLRLRHGQSLDAARAELAVARLALRPTLSSPGAFARALTWQPYQQVLGHARRADLLVLQAAILFALLLACVNVAALQVLRAVARQGELATRAAIGGGPARLAQQMVVESMALACAGALVGAGLAWWAVPQVQALIPRALLDGVEVAPDWRVLGVGLALTALVGLCVGVIPARAAARVDLRAALGAPGRATAGHAALRWRRVFVIAQVSLALVLVVSAALLARTLGNFHRVDLGFDPASLVAGAMSMQGASDQTSRAPADFIEHTLTRLRQVPGVAEATVTTNLPIDRALNLAMDAPAGALVTDTRAVDWQYVASGYTQTLGIPVRAGRTVSHDDTGASAPVALVNEAFARAYFGDEPVLGRQIRLDVGDIDEPARTIVGVLGDVRATSGTGWTEGRNALDVPSAPGVYVPVSQVSPDLLDLVHDFARVQWVVRATDAPGAVTRRVAALMRESEPRLPFIEFVPLTALVARELEMERALLWLMGLLGGGALLLAALGTYGLMAASVHARLREIGIRLVLGASRTSVVRDVAREGALVLLVGLACGVPAVVLATRVIRAYLWGVGPFDPWALGVASGALAVVAMAAVLVPAVRAARVAPARVLRS
jgi:putative ABC transport system permease protein